MAEIFALGYFDAPYIPKKEIEAKVSTKANECIARYKVEEVKGKQLDAYAEVHALAHKDAEAEAIFARRLAESGISVREKGQALNAAVRAFNTPDFPERIKLAEKYLAQLTALPIAEAGREIVDAHLKISNSYRLLGRTAEQIAVGLKGLTLAKQLASLDRGSLSGDMISSYNDLAEAYTNLPDSKSKLDEMAKIVRSPAMPDPPYMKHGFEKAIERGYMLGKTAPDVYANHWFNVPMPAEGKLKFAGQKTPWVVEFTQFG
jgi:hypothetical protein